METIDRASDMIDVVMLLMLYVSFNSLEEIQLRELFDRNS